MSAKIPIGWLRAAARRSDARELPFFVTILAVLSVGSNKRRPAIGRPPPPAARSAPAEEFFPEDFQAEGEELVRESGGEFETRFGYFVVLGHFIDVDE